LLEQYPACSNASLIKLRAKRGPRSFARRNGSPQRIEHAEHESGRTVSIDVAAGPNWAALPATVGFIDPLYSTGIAHTLFGVRHLAAILKSNETADRTQSLHRYSIQVIEGLQLIDELVEGCYASLPSFQLWSDWYMLCFAAVTSMENATSPRDDISFLRANDATFRRVISAARKTLDGVERHDAGENRDSEFTEKLRELIKPWNHVGLLSDSVHGMYSRTAAA
jgi:tetracycline 7-halogenase / FADH2 O2-dependent halogenase